MQQDINQPWNDSEREAEIEVKPEEVTEANVRHLKFLYYKSELESCMKMSAEQCRLRDKEIAFWRKKADENEAEKNRLVGELKDALAIVQDAAVRGTVRVEALAGPFDPSALFEVDKDEFKNKLITTLGFADKKFFMQFSKERKLIRLVTDTDLNKEIAELVPQQPPV